MKQFALAAVLGVAMSADVESYRYRLQQAAPFSHGYQQAHIASPHDLRNNFERELPEKARGNGGES